jgi:SAM-dependent methyltransferase
MSDSNGSEGYVEGASYPVTFFRELSPVWLNYVAALNGAAPRDLDRGLSYLELGCGHGVSTLVHAASLPAGKFHACDFNPDHIASAERRAAALRVENVRFYETSFEALRKQDLPGFDFIVLHGVYTWVGGEAQETIRALIREKLEPGGLVYVSYNCLPGWSSEMPLRKLLSEFAAASVGSLSDRTEYALRTLERLSESGLQYFREHPSAANAVDAYVRSPRNYLAHEFLNEVWDVRYAVDVAEEMAEADVRYLGSATLADNHPSLVMSSSAADAISELATLRERRLAEDFALNRQFRRDVFVRASSDEGVDVGRHLSEAVVGCLGSTEAIGTTANVPRGKISFHADFIGELRDVMAGGSATLGELASALHGEARDEGGIVRNLLYLIAAGVLTPFAKRYRPTVSGEPPRFADATVQRMFESAAKSDVPEPIASEVVGSGIEMDPTDAAAILDHVARGGPSEGDDARAELVRRLGRLGILV